MGVEQPFWSQILSHCDPVLLYHSRIHAMPSLHTSTAKVWVKREDESGFGISGCKKRKYASLLPYLKQHQIQTVGLLGSYRSNHIVGLIQLLREARIKPVPFLKMTHSQAAGGNAFLMRLLTGALEIKWIEKEDWPLAPSIARDYLESLTEAAFLVPEGGCCAPCLPGISTLMMDIERNEADQELCFQHLFVDAGSGLTASSLVLYNHLFKEDRNIHVVLTAGSQEDFRHQVEQVMQWYPSLTGRSLSSLPTLQSYYPVTAKAYGSVNRTVRNAVERYALEEGILCDPIYTAKLFLTAEHIIQSQQLEGNCLLIHGGGGTGLMGFGEKWLGYN